MRLYQRHAGALLDGGHRQGAPLAAGGPVSEVAHRVDGLTGATGGDDDVPSCEEPAAPIRFDCVVVPALPLEDG